MHGLKNRATKSLAILSLGLLSLTGFAGQPGVESSTLPGEATVGKYLEAPLAGVGYIGGYKESGDIDPENTPATILTSSSSYGWDYRNRSLVIDLGLRKTISQIILFDNKIDNKGTASNLNKESIRIYYSNDNKKYVRYEQDYGVNVEKGDGATNDGKPVFDIIEIGNLSIKARYIKLNTTYSGDACNFALENTQTAIKAFQSRKEFFEIADIYLENRILTWGKNKFYADVIIPEGRKANLIIALTSGAKVLTVAKAAVKKSGKLTFDYKVAGLEPGAYELVCKLQSENGDIEAEKTLELKLFSRLVPFKELKQAATAQPGDGAVTSGPAQAADAPFVTWFKAGANSLKRFFGRLFAGKDSGQAGMGQAGMGQAGVGEIVIIDDFKDIMADPNCSFLSYENVITKKQKTLAVLKAGANPVKVFLPTNGWCAIYVGLQNNSGGLHLQLEGEKEGKACSPGKDPRREIDLVAGKVSLSDTGGGKDQDLVTDVFFKYADLKAQNLIIKPLDKNKEVRLAYIKVMFLTDKQIQLVKGETDISIGKKYIYTEDGYQNWKKHDILKMVNKFAGHPEIEAYAWGIGGSAMYYPTKIGTLLGEGADFASVRKLDKEYVDSLYDLIKAGTTPIDMASKEAHRIGAKVYALYRMNAEYTPPYDKLFNSKFWREHPEYRVISSQDGMKNPHMSYAFPEVRKYKLDLLREAVENYDVDGVHMEFLRSAPYFGYEHPLVEGFQSEYGIDALASDFKPDDKWYRYRARFMTEFVRDLRKILDEVGQKKGKHLWLGARVDYSEYLQQGLDVETWIKEGLVDMVAAGVNGLGYPYAPADEFIKMATGTKCKVYGSTSPEGAGYRDPTPEDDKTGGYKLVKSTSASLNMRRRRHLEYFKAGAQGMYLFNEGGTYLGGYNNLERWGEFEDPLLFNVAPIKMSGN